MLSVRGDLVLYATGTPSSRVFRSNVYKFIFGRTTPENITNHIDVVAVKSKKHIAPGRNTSSKTHCFAAFRKRVVYFPRRLALRTRHID